MQKTLVIMNNTLTNLFSKLQRQENLNNGDLSMIFSVGGLSQGISGLIGTC